MKSLIQYCLVVLLLCPLLVQSCKKETESAGVSNLSLSAEVSSDGSGLVNFTASASNANRYYFNFGTSANEEGTRSTTGTISHRYTSSGTYTVKVTAYSADNKSAVVTKEISVSVNSSGEENTSPENYPGMSLIWRDEFNGSSLNTGDWTFETGTGNNGWGNNELQYYRQENVSVADGFLTITAKRESFGGREYTSSRIKTQDKKIFRYGRIDIRAKLPKGKGIWPALWMLGNNISTVSWPQSGEIDIMELVGGGPGFDNTVHGTIHYENNGTYATTGKSFSLASGDFSDKFHVFSLIWDATELKWLVDDVQFYAVNITAPAMSEFHNHFFLLFNVAVGGNWPGSPDATTILPQKMMVDYVRVFQKQ
ncbi:family 16 glycosylhydrolase [Pedobacter sp. SYSU D00535]|uniref:family 16 glycosylhydrolase n=1 Tax=Pedobacter sp. SYSU D00535 TaxID=2810308 RepID=UPI001A9799F1|nr:family 16 glycosylhydrolase [Pedobacter sp. SYSU D00535]